MYPPPAPGMSAREIWSYLVRFPKRWLIPAGVVAAVVAAYAVVRPNTYEASLPVMIRNETSTDVQAPGKFRQEDEMKISEETVMEVASSRRVLARALKQVGPAIDERIVDVWPSDAVIDSLRSALKVAPPKGAEFGKTEIFYLKVADKDPRRAVKLVDAIYDQLKADLAEIRNERARSIVADLEKVVALAEGDLEKGTKRLKGMESETGADLIELRMVFQGTAMDGELNKTLVASQSELRQWKSAQAANREMLRLLQAAQRDPQHLVAAPAPLLESQPALRQLKQGLVEAQLRASVLAGTLTEDHPQLVVARQAEQDIKRSIHTEVATACRCVEGEIQVTEGRIRAAEDQLAAQRGRIERLAGLRAEYSNLVDQVEHHRSELDSAKHYLAGTLANQASSPSSSVINRVGDADGFHLPIGPSRSMIALAGVAAGLICGWGILYLTAPPRPPRYPVQGRFYRPALPEMLFYPDGTPAGYSTELWRPELALPLYPNGYPNGDGASKPR
jgi:uncharacterized protein involved in exopolysaccharide biosynthesis